jgi:hypothetical protein
MRTAVLTLVGLLVAAGALAQETRLPVRVTVLQVAGSTVYVDAGSSAGLAEGMSVDVREEGGAALGSLVVLGVTGDGAGLTFQGRAFPITRGQTLILEIPVAGEGGVVEAGAEADTVRARGGAPVGAAAPGVVGPAGRGLRVTGTLGLELETYRATSSWAEQVDGTVTRQLVRPALRFRGDLTGLPAGFTASTDLRVWHRSSDASVYEPGTSVRVYRASLARDAGPLRLEAGRFWARELPFSAYWDGAMMRVGGAAGAGVAAGFTPTGGAEGVDTDAPKVAAFVDYEQRGIGPQAWGAVSFVQERLPWEDTTVRSLGWTQHARWGAASLDHRIEWELGADDPIAHANVDLSFSLPQGTRFSAGWIRDRYRPIQQVDSLLLPPRVRERATVGLGWSGRPGGFDVRGGLLGGDEDGHSIDGTLWTAPVARGWPTLSLAASYWATADRTWLFVSPSVRKRFGVVDARAAYHHYRIDDVAAVRLHGGDISATFPLGPFRGRLGVRGEGGADLVTVRLISSLWLRF